MKEESGIFMPWDEQYSIGIGLVDRQHKELLRLTNMLHSACREGSTAAQGAFQSTVHALVDYVQVHFATEEKLMRQFRFTGMEDHLNEHREFVRTVLDKVRVFQKGELFVPLAFTGFLKEWIIGHIARADKKLGTYIVGVVRREAMARRPPDAT
ncbi:MAG: bacteriohemerythrin [Treponema sp.]|nr:bacteriohemerythrin [Treponema sp.]